MEGKVLILLAALAVALGTPISQKPNDLQTAFSDYVSWSERASQAFLQDEITSMEVDSWESSGQDLYDTLAAALQEKATELRLDLSTDNEEVENTILTTLENGLLPNIQPDVLVGLLSSKDIFENHGAKLHISSDLFKEITLRLRDLVEDFENEEDIDAEKLMEIVEVLYASEIAFDGIVSNFQSVEEEVLGNDDAETETGTETGEKTETETEDSDAEEDATVTPTALSRRKRQNNRIPLGGGFSTNGRSVMYNRGRTSVTATPHFSLRPKPAFHGATVGANHRFRNNRGSVFGSATVNNRGRVTGAHVGIRIKF